MNDDPNATRISGQMEEDPVTDNGEGGKSNRNIIIAVVAAIVLCCCCSTVFSVWWAWSSGQLNF